MKQFGVKKKVYTPQKLNVICLISDEKNCREASETYCYFDLPFCTPDHVKEKQEALGEVLDGDRLVTAPYKLNFLVDRDSEIICKKALTKEDAAKFRDAVSKDYYFQIKDRVIRIVLRTDPNSVVDITDVKEVGIELLYTVKWKETNTPFEDRMDKYSQSSSMAHHLQIHWFSIMNPCVTVLLLTGFLAAILTRVLKNDFVKIWHPAVYPLISVGMVFSTVYILLLSLVVVFYPYNRGALFTALMVIYALTSGVAGYVAASFYCQLEGTNWVKNLLWTRCLFCGPLFLTFCFQDTPCNCILIWTLVTSPLLVLGGTAGKNSKKELFQAPCWTTKYPREIQCYIYRERELYYIFASVWGHRIYTIYGILFIVFISSSVTAFITVALAYVQLAAEDHEWWWSPLSTCDHLHPYWINLPLVYIIGV